MPRGIGCVAVKTTNRGAMKLLKLCPGHGDQTRLASELGLGTNGQSLISRWARAKRKPDTPNRIKLQKKLDIGWALWDDEVEIEEREVQRKAGAA